MNKAEQKDKARQELDSKVYGGGQSLPLRDGTIGHVEGPAGTWNTSGVEVPAHAGSVRDVRPESGDAVTLEQLREIGVPVRDASEYRSEGPAPFMPQETAEAGTAKTEDRTLQIEAAREADEEAKKETSSSKKSPKK